MLDTSAANTRAKDNARHKCCEHQGKGQCWTQVLRTLGQRTMLDTSTVNTRAKDNAGHKCCEHQGKGQWLASTLLAAIANW